MLTKLETNALRHLEQNNWISRSLKKNIYTMPYNINRSNKRCVFVCIYNFFVCVCVYVCICVCVCVLLDLKSTGRVKIEDCIGFSF